MGLTLTPLKRLSRVQLGALDGHVVDIAFDSSYDAGGETLSGAGVRENDVVGFQKISGDAESAGYVFNLNHVTGKLQAYRGFAGRLESYAPGGGDVKGATNPAGTEGNADQAAAPVNAGLLKAATAVATLAGTITPTAQPAIPRNVVITVTNDSGGALDLFEGTTTFTITGTDFDGAAQTETVTLVSTSGNKSVADAKFRYVQGVKAFRTVTSVTYTNAPASTLKLGLGVGTRIGLPAALETATYTDVLGVSVDAVPKTISATVANAGGVDTTNNTVNVGTIADGADIGIDFKAAARQVAAGTDLSGVSLRAIVYTLNGGF